MVTVNYNTILRKDSIRFVEDFSLRIWAIGHEVLLPKDLDMKNWQTQSTKILGIIRRFISS
jgi:hypothetical protein